MSNCKIEGCDAPVKYKGLCGKHYKRQWRHGDATKTLINMGDKGICSVVSCDNPIRYPITGLCNTHHHRVMRYGRTARIVAQHGAGTTNSAGYRLLTINGKRVYEHVVVAERALGKPLPVGAVVHHVNGNPGDNRPENLVICPNQAYHMLLHKRQGIN